MLIPFDFKANDVVCCRGGFRLHPGNLYYNKLLTKFVHRLAQTHRLTKQDNDEVVDTILDIILNRRQGRFLKPAGDFKLANVLTREALEYKIRCDLRMKRLRFHNRRASKKPSKLRIAAKKCPPNKQIGYKVAARPKTDSNALPITATATFNETPSSPGSVDLDDFDDDCGSTCSSPTAAPSHLPEKFTSRQGLAPLPILSSSSSTEAGDATGCADLLYGSEHDEIHMRRWLKSHKLPQSVGDVLLDLGARNVDDVMLLVRSHSKLLQELAVLDMVKLHRAVQEKC